MPSSCGNRAPEPRTWSGRKRRCVGRRRSTRSTRRPGRTSPCSVWSGALPSDPLFPYATRAIELEPDNPDYRLLALRIAARGGEVEAARAAARQMLKTVAGQDRRPVEAFLAELDVLERSSAGGEAGSGSASAAVAPQGVPAAGGVFANPDGNSRLTESGTSLGMSVPGGTYDLSPEIGQVTAPRLLRPAEGDFVAEVTIPRAPEPADRPKASGGDSTTRFPYHGLGLLVWQDESNFVRFELAVYVPPVGAPVRYALLEWRRNGVLVGGFAPSRIRLDATRTQLRLERRGDSLQASVRQKSADWIAVGRMEVVLPKALYVGVAAVNTSKGPLEAEFADFAVSPPPEWRGRVQRLCPSRSASTIRRTSSLKVTFGCQPSWALALAGSPRSRSTSAGRKYLESTFTKSFQSRPTAPKASSQNSWTECVSPVATT